MSPLPPRNRGRARNLPRPLTPLIGREQVGASVAAQLRDDGVRLLTLLGPGGVGKTRLAIAVAWELADGFADGAVFVPLDSVRASSLVASRLVQALGIREFGNRSMAGRLQSYLRDRCLLMVLDNVEHVADAAPLVSDLLQASPRLTVLTTSRVRLRLSGERTVTVPPLALPDPAHLPSVGSLAEYAAIRLFIDRARLVRGDFTLTELNAPAVAEICHRLDGLPLAIELAAARSGMLPPPALLARLATRLPMLTGGPTDAPARLQTMRGAIVWSHDLLNQEEQALFRRLAVFVGGFTLEAAERVMGDRESVMGETAPPSPIPHSPSPPSVLDLLTALVDKSLVDRGDAADGEPRFAVLETIREYALEQLAASGEEPTIRDAHAAYFLALAEQAEPKLTGPVQARWLDRLEREQPNLRMALAWLATHERAEEALRLAGALSHFWVVHGHLTEGRTWLERLLAHPSAGTGSTRSRAHALSGAGTLAYFQGDRARAAACHEQSLALYRTAGDMRGEAVALSNLGFQAHLQGDAHRAETLLAESLALCRELGDGRSMALALDKLGVIATEHGDQERAAALLEESLALFREAGDQWWIGVALLNLGVAAKHRGDAGRATACFWESLAISRTMGNHRLTAYSLSYLGLLAEEQGDLGGAVARYAEGLALCRDLGGQLPTPRFLEGLARTADDRGHPERATRLFGAAHALRIAIGSVMFPADRARYDRGVAAVRRTLGMEAFANAWEAGRKLTPEQAIDEALVVAMEPALVVDTKQPGVSAAVRGLTPRELDVLRLLVEGRTDPGIGEALGISVRTVETHVASLLNKLGAGTRTAAAATAIRRGLI
ncbi:MAG: ATP-binding protein [Thermoanaerobaculia bacterium]